MRESEHSLTSGWAASQGKGKQPREKIRGSQYVRREEKIRPKQTIRIPFIQRPERQKNPFRRST